MYRGNIGIAWFLEKIKVHQNQETGFHNLRMD